MRPANPIRNKHTILKQMCEYIPAYLVPKLAIAHDIRTRAFSPWCAYPLFPATERLI